MIINVHKNDSPQYEGFGPELYLEPQNDRDREQLEYIRTHYKTVGYGRTPAGGGTWKMLHVRIALQEKPDA